MYAYEEESNNEEEGKKERKLLTAFPLFSINLENSDKKNTILNLASCFNTILDILHCYIMARRELITLE
jgi:hypothetical protein